MIRYDEVVLCLNYDGKFGLNKMNNYFQNANKKGIVVQLSRQKSKIFIMNCYYSQPNDRHDK